jgi:hypothetical protein
MSGRSLSEIISLLFNSSFSVRQAGRHIREKTTTTIYDDGLIQIVSDMAVSSWVASWLMNFKDFYLATASFGSVDCRTRILQYEECPPAFLPLRASNT